jgi:hypothetical protein
MRLHFGRATERIHHTAELDEEAVTCCLDEPAVIRGDRWTEQLDLDRLERLESTVLVRS